jgi:hypothetical protein
MTAFAGACSLLERALTGDARRGIVADLSKSKDFRTALLRLRDSMRAHSWAVGGSQINLGRIIKTFDGQTRDDGFHALNDWDGEADKVNEDTIPVDVLNYLIEKRGDGPIDPVVHAILLDYYFFHILSLLSLRVWDEGDADENLDWLARLLADLQGPDGSGQPFVGNAETLLLIATSHFEIVEQGYDKLLAHVRTLNRSHRTNVALGHAASMGSHLRFGFEATYGRDTVNMRNDNVADYPWLCFALVSVMREYARLREEDAGGADGTDRERIVEAMLNGLTPDPRAFIGQPPSSLSACDVERSEFTDFFHRYKDDLLEEFERHRPTADAYSPMSFFFNFSHNVLKGTVIDALLRGAAWDVTFNDLLTGMPRGGPKEGPKDESKVKLAETLMGYARNSPSRIRGRLMPVIVYDPDGGRRAFVTAMSKMKE